MVDLSKNYGRPWRVGSAQGQHEEDGIRIETVDGLLVLVTPSVYEVARAIYPDSGVFRQNSFHDIEAWHAYHAVANLIVKNHNDALPDEVLELV